MIVREIFDKRVPPYIALSLDFEGTDAEFVQTNKNMAIEIIGEVIGEIEDGFIDGMNDVLPFIKENMKTMITEACDPKNAALAVMMALPPIMNFVERANETYKKQKEEAKQNASQPKQADRQDVQMEEESKELVEDPPAKMQSTESAISLLLSDKTSQALHNEISVKQLEAEELKLLITIEVDRLEETEKSHPINTEPLASAVKQMHAAKDKCL